MNSQCLFADGERCFSLESIIVSSFIQDVQSFLLFSAD